MRILNCPSPFLWLQIIEATLPGWPQVFLRSADKGVWGTEAIPPRAAQPGKCGEIKHTQQESRVPYYCSTVLGGSTFPSSSIGDAALATVYRVENAEGKGPYVGFTVFGWGYGHDSRNLWLDKRTDDRDTHPTPSSDGIRIRGEKWKCGFSSIDQLCDWFTVEDLDRMFRYGFRIMEFEVEEVQFGEKQVMFHNPISSRVYMDSFDSVNEAV